MYRKKKRKTKVRFFLVCILAVLVALLDGGRIGHEQSVQEVERSPAGQGRREESFTVKRKGEKEKTRVRVTVEEKTLTKKEARAAIKKTEEGLDRAILGKNRSFDHVDRKLNFPDWGAAETVCIDWSFEPDDLVERDGQIAYEKISDSGSLLHVKALLSCQGEEARYERHLKLYPPKVAGLKGDVFEARRRFKSAEENTREKEQVKLPQKVNGRELVWKKEKTNRGPAVFVLGTVCVLLPLVREKEASSKKKREMNQKKTEDYPDIVSKMALLVGAGMTIRNAFTKIAKDYRGGGGEKRPAYEEMIQTVREMESGQSEALAYENFGRRLARPEYVKLGQILSQQVRMGGGGLKNVLESEASLAFEEKKRDARRRGEEVSAKLLLPMFLMMGVVLAVVMVPAFVSMRG